MPTITLRALWDYSVTQYDIDLSSSPPAVSTREYLLEKDMAFNMNAYVKHRKISDNRHQLTLEYTRDANDSEIRHWSNIWGAATLEFGEDGSNPTVRWDPKPARAGYTGTPFLCTVVEDGESKELTGAVFKALSEIEKKHNESKGSVVDILKPKERQRVIDVVGAVGLPNDWKGGSTNRHENGRWCFGSVGGVTLGFVWWENLRKDPTTGDIYFINDAEEWESKYRQDGDKRGEAKARNFDRLINNSFFAGRPIHVAIVDGPEPGNQDKVERRELDSELWYPHHWDPHAKQIVVIRGVPQPGGFDPTADFDWVKNGIPAPPSSEFNVPLSSAGPENDISGKEQHPVEPELGVSEEEDPSPPKKVQGGMVYVRSPDVARMAKARADGSCILCEGRSFIMESGGWYLESHHVVPLKWGVDAIWNVVAVCANHHKEAHFGKRRVELRDTLITYLGDLYPGRRAKLVEMAKRMDLDEDTDEVLESELDN